MINLHLDSIIITYAGALFKIADAHIMYDEGSVTDNWQDFYYELAEYERLYLSAVTDKRRGTADWVLIKAPKLCEIITGNAEFYYKYSEDSDVTKMIWAEAVKDQKI